MENGEEQKWTATTTKKEPKGAGEGFRPPQFTRPRTSVFQVLLRVDHHSFHGVAGWSGGRPVLFALSCRRSDHAKTLSKHIASKTVLVWHVCSMSLSSQSFVLSITMRFVGWGGRFIMVILVSFHNDVRTCETTPFSSISLQVFLLVDHHSFHGVGGWSEHVGSTMVLVLHACSMSLTSKSFFFSITTINRWGGVDDFFFSDFFERRANF